MTSTHSGVAGTPGSTGDGPDTAASGAAAVEAVEAADIEMGKRLASRRHHPLVRAASTVAELGDQGPLYAMGGALMAAGLASRNGQLARTGAAVLAAVAAADAGKTLTKRLVRRTRPNVLLEHGRYEAGVGGSGRKPEQSFPSGHVAGSVAAALAVSRRYPRAGAVGCVLGLAAGLARVAGGAHWPLDLAAGTVVGIGAAGLSGGLLRAVGLPKP